MTAVTSLDEKWINKEELLTFWRAHPVQAAKEIFGATDPDFDLDIPQKIILNSRFKHKYQLDIMTRGGGKSYLNSITAWLFAILYPGQKIGLLAPTFRQSKFMFNELSALHETSPLLQEMVEHGPSTLPDRCYVKLKGGNNQVGSLIEALPMGDGTTVRGARYYVALADELAQFSEQVLDVVVAGFLATQKDPMKRVKMARRMKRQLEAGEITQQQYDDGLEGSNVFIGSSTAYYQFNHLWGRECKLINEIYEEKQRLIRLGQPNDHLVVRGGELNEGQIPARYMSNGRSAMCVFPWYDMSPGFMDADYVRAQRESLSDYHFKMEYTGYSPPDSEGFFRLSLLNAARSHNRFSVSMSPTRGCTYVLGIDPARSGDNFAVALGEVDMATKVGRLVRVWAWKNRPFPEVNLQLREIIRQFDVKLIKMDAGGGGSTVRDLFADQRNCPAGQKLILEQGQQSHLSLVGDRILAPLVQFSKYEWVRDTNEGLKSALEHGRLQIAAPGPLPGELYTPLHEEAYDEIQSTIAEMSSVITKATGNRLNWDTPSKSSRKDRYSATLLLWDGINDLIGKGLKTGLAAGFWM